jgi:sarcosine oxidase, subunit gamma
MLDVSSSRAAALPSVGTGNNSAVTLTASAPAARFVLRGNAATRIAAGAVFGVTLPEKPGCAESRYQRAALWLGPDEWLLIDMGKNSEAVQRSLSAALIDVPHSLVDVSHRQTAIAVTGPKAALALNAFVPLDLALEAFPVGMATRTVFEKAEIVLWRRAPEAFHIEVWRSFAPYVASLLSNAQSEMSAQ